MVDATRLPATGHKPGDYNSWLTFTPLMTGDTVSNISLPYASAVPLGLLTKAAWKSHDLLSQPWLLVGSVSYRRGMQQWFVELCNRAGLSGQERHFFATYIKNGWLSSMVVEKRIASHGAGTADSDIDPASQVTPTRMPSAPPMITVAVDGFRVTYLKYGYKLAFRLDTDVLRFIPGYLYLQAMKFRASPPRNLGWQKVRWNKDEARWDVYLSTGEQLSEPCVDWLSVDKSLPFEKFQAQKLSSHQRAVDLWNEKDGTYRKRQDNKRIERMNTNPNTNRKRPRPVGVGQGQG